jgi:hypothetical protein
LLISNYIASKLKNPFISFVIYPKRSRKFPVVTTRYYLSLYLFRDQAVQADFCRDTKKKRYLYPLGTIIIVVKPLHRIPESGTYWFATYNKYYIEKLLITISPYDPCLFINTTKGFFVILVI